MAKAPTAKSRMRSGADLVCGRIREARVSQNARSADAEVIVPNTHPIFDPAWGAATLDRLFRRQLIVLADLVKHGVDLLMRSLETGPDDIPHHVILSVLYRQALVSADAAHQLLSNGAIDAAQLQLRVQMEARWGLILALRDPLKWGTHLYVASLHEQRSWLSQWIPGTREYDANSETRDLKAKYGGDESHILQADAERSRESINAIRSREKYAAISRGFEHYEERNGRPPPWYYDPATPKDRRLTSIWKLAAEVGARGEYKTVYRHASYFVHGGYTGTHLKHEKTGPVVGPMRTPEGARQALLLACGYLAECSRRVLDNWRPGELGAFLKRYETEWRPAIHDMPDVEVRIDRAVNRG
jgi:hypothetical protein